jgi:hypothetical protein
VLQQRRIDRQGQRPCAHASSYIGGDSACTALTIGYRLDTSSARAFLAHYVTLPQSWSRRLRLAVPEGPLSVEGRPSSYPLASGKRHDDVSSDDDAPGGLFGIIACSG